MKSKPRVFIVESLRFADENVGIAPPAVAYTCSNDANTDFFWRHDVFSLLRLMKLT
jgi:hypothetical protein